MKNVGLRGSFHHTIVSELQSLKKTKVDLKIGGETVKPGLEEKDMFLGCRNYLLSNTYALTNLMFTKYLFNHYLLDPEHRNGLLIYKLDYSSILKSLFNKSSVPDIVPVPEDIKIN